MKNLIPSFIFYFIILLNCQLSYSQWSEFPAPTNTALYSGSMGFNQSIYVWSTWVCGVSGSVFKSKSFGSWRTVNSGIPSTVTLVSMSAFDSSLALAAGYTGSNTYAYRTSDGGNSWSQVFTQANSFINGIWLKDSTTAILVGNPVAGRWSIWRSTNGGLSWDSAGRYLIQNGTETGWNNSIYCRGDNIWFGTNNYRIYFSTNYGISWAAQSTGSMQNVYCVYFDEWSNCSGFAGGSTLLQTNNCGINWTQVSNVQGTGNIVGIAASNPGVDNPVPPYWYARGNTIYELQGVPYSYTAPAGNYTYMFRYFRGGSLYFPSNFAPRNNGGVSYCGCTFGRVEKTGNQIPDKFSLYQNYPNPFNPKSLIRFDLTKSTSVILKVFDITGREVITLVDEQLKPGTYETEFDGTNIPSGVYYYRLIAGDYDETMKMALIK